MLISNKKVWVIMTKDRKLIVKGPDLSLIPVDSTDGKRLTTYTTKGAATSSLKRSYFYGVDEIEGFRDTPETKYEYLPDPNDKMKDIKNPNYIQHSEFLEAVEVSMHVETVEIKTVEELDQDRKDSLERTAKMKFHLNNIGVHEGDLRYEQIMGGINAVCGPKRD